jgi:folate-binding protein YgfZ
VAIALPGGGFILNLTADSVLAAQLVAEKATAVSSQAWGIRDIDAGIAWVTLATQEQFVPQMANMDLIGAVSFKKGCYPGQEIVARTQYLGKVKRRLFKASLAVSARGETSYSVRNCRNNQLVWLLQFVLWMQLSRKRWWLYRRFAGRKGFTWKLNTSIPGLSDIALCYSG